MMIQIKDRSRGQLWIHLGSQCSSRLVEQLCNQLSDQFNSEEIWR